MPTSLYDAIIPSFQQTLGAVAGLVSKAEAHCAEKKIAPADLLQARLFEDMQPFTYQVKSTVGHSIGAIEGVRSGVYKPDLAPPPGSFAALKDSIAGAIAALGAVKAQENNGFEGRDMFFEIRDTKLPFTAENFLLSFSLPNFYFHATTAYDILRHSGVPLGKRDFLGQMRLKT